MHAPRIRRARHRRARLATTLAVAVALAALAALAACQPLPPGGGGSPPVTGDGVIDTPLSTNGGKIVDAEGEEVVLAGVNWFGFETEINVVHGLWARDHRAMLAQMADLGYNTIRLPWSVQSLRAPAISGVNTSLGANAALAGRTPLEAMDIIIDAAADEGLLILLDNHRLNNSSIPELWYGDGYTEQDWLDTWTMLAERYRDRWNVIGADLKNEPHGAATWGAGDPATDWRLAAERAGEAIHAVAPDWLIVVEGIGGWVAGQQLSGHWWGGNLEGVRAAPVRLSRPNKLVYSPHEYGPGVHDQPWFSSPDLAATLLDRWEKGFAYIAKEGIAPILVGEFGGRQVGTDTVEGRWQNWFVDYLAARGYSWTYWSWNPNSSDTGGILMDDWTTVHATKQSVLDRALAVAGAAGSGPGTVTTTAPATTATTGAPTTTTTTPTGALTASARVTSTWASGYCLQFSVTNSSGTTASVSDLSFSLTGATFTTTWNGELTTSGDRHRAVLPGWARHLSPGQTLDSFGYCADPGGTDRPRSIVVG